MSARPIAITGGTSDHIVPAKRLTVSLPSSANAVVTHSIIIAAIIPAPRKILFFLDIKIPP